MLNLVRREGQSVIIGPMVTVVMVEAVCPQGVRVRVTSHIDDSAEVYTLSKEESIALGCDAQMKVLRVGATYTCLGFKAPREVAIVREEIYDKLDSRAERGSP